MTILELEKLAEEILYQHKQNANHQHDWATMEQPVQDLNDVRVKMIHDGLIKRSSQKYGVTQLELKGINFTTYQNERDKVTAKEYRAESKEDYDLLTKKWIYKTRYFPYAASAIAVIISFASYFKPEKKPVDLQPLQQEIQGMKEQMKVLDSLYRANIQQKKDS